MMGPPPILPCSTNCRPAARERQLQIQLVGQNLATVAFLLLILAGNVAILVTGRRGDA